MVEFENVYSEEHVISSFIVDGKRLLRPTALFGLMQEVADNHVEGINCGWYFLHTMNRFWALSRMDVEIIRRPAWKERVLISTWGKKHNYLIQPRDYLVETPYGETLVRATSNWVVLDTEGKPCLVSEIDDRLRLQPDLHALEKPAARLRKAVEGEPQQFRPVVYSDIDMNHHVNNASYVTWAMDCFPYDFHRNHELTHISLNYLKQTRSDDCYAVLKKETSPGVFALSAFSEREGEETCRMETRWKVQK